MEFWTTKLAAAVLLPPAGPLLLAAAGLLLARVWRRSGLMFAALGLALLWGFSTPYFGSRLARLVEPVGAPQISLPGGAQALVILSGGTYFRAPEYGGADTVGSYTLERLRWGARLHRQTGLPVVVTGGSPLGMPSSEASQMKESLAHDFQITVRWVEDRSRTTYESAFNTRALLQEEGIHRILLVTHASHMKRAHWIFTQAGFEVLDAPTAFTTPDPPSLLDLVPSPEGLVNSRIFFHEFVGNGWYHVRRWIDGRKPE